MLSQDINDGSISLGDSCEGTLITKTCDRTGTFDREYPCFAGGLSGENHG